MSKASRFGFLLGLLAGTAAVGTIGIMTGQGNTTRHPDPRPGFVVATQSDDRSTIYLWTVEPETGELTFLRQSPIPKHPAIPPQD